MTLSWVKRGMLGSMLGGAYFRSPSCRRLQSRGRLGLRPYTALRTIAADVGPQNAGLDCASNWLASRGKSTLTVERARRSRPSSDENGISSWRTFAVGASSAEAAENWIVVSSSARAKRVPSCVVGSESLLHRNNLTGIHAMSAIGGKADMTVCESPLSRSLLGVKRT